MIVLVANSSRIKVVSGKKNDKVGYVFLQFEIWALQGTSIDEEYIECISKFKAMHSSIYGECESTKSLHTVAREEKTSLFINVSSSLNQERQQCSIKLETCETINFGQCYIHIYTGDYTYLPIDTGINIVSWDGVSIFLGEWQRHESTSSLDYKVNWNALQLWEH